MLASILQSRLRLTLVGLLLGGALILLVLRLIAGVVHQNGLDQLQQRVDRHAFDLQAETVNGTAMGALSLMGLTDDQVKQIAVAELPWDAPPLMARLTVVREWFQAATVFIMAADGTIVAYNSGGKSSAGKNVGYRPYFQQAMKGTANVYAAVGSNSGKRGLYFAAPVYQGTDTSTPVIGAIMLKMKLKGVDEFLAQRGHPALLLSPQGIVFAASRADWRYRISGTASGQRWQQIKDSKQFGKLFAQRPPQPLPFDVNAAVITLAGISYVPASAPLRWHDPGGQWTLVELEDARNWFPLRYRLAIAATLALLMLLLGIALYASARSRHNRAESQRLIDASNRRLRQVTDSFPGAIFQLRRAADGDYHFSFISNGIETLLGIHLSESGRDFAPLLSAVALTDREALLNSLQRAADTQLPWQHEFRVHTSQQHTKWLFADARVHRNDDGSTVFNGYCTDVSERHQVREELAAARDKAEAATRAKSEFLANMSHEIRTPMNAVMGLTHLALKTDLDSRQRDYLSKIDGSARALLGIINDILDFSKIEAGKLDIETIPFDLQADVLDNLANVIGLKAGEKGTELLFDFDTELPLALQGDPLRLSQILINLMNNAVKFTDGGEITLRIRILEQQPRQVSLRFEIIDSGIGMSSEQQARLFQSFSQADSSTTRRYGGTGLGLTISKRLVEMMGGDIGLHSRPAEGSTFWFSIPLQLTTAPAERAQPGGIDSLRVLVVDANRHSRHILSRYLQSFGCRVSALDNSEEAFTLLQACSDNQPFDLLLSDWQLPATDGLTLVRQMADDSRLASTHGVIMVSAYHREALHQQTTGRDPAQILLKPISPSTLRDALLQSLGKQTGRQPAGHDVDAPATIVGARLLLVEDNAINQQVASEILEAAGVEVTIAANGQLAVDQLSARPSYYDGVLMDIQMPELDGYQASEQIRGRLGLSDLPIIAMTANAMARDRERALAAGMNDHIAKPIDVQQLFEVLSRWVSVPEGREQRQPLAATPAPDPAAGYTALLHQAGFDTAAALSRLGGRQALYLNILQRFRDSQRDSPRQIRDALASADHATAERLAHTLKGLAGNIGNPSLQTDAGALERAIHDRDSDDATAPLLNALEARLDGILAQLDQLDAEVGSGHQTTAPGSSAEPDPEARQALMTTLHTQLADDDADAADTLEQLRQLGGTPGFIDALEPLAAAIDDFDFELAQQRLNQLQQLQSTGGPM